MIFGVLSAWLDCARVCTRARSVLAGFSVLLSVISTGAHAAGFQIEIVTEDLNHAWGMSFIPNDSRMLVSERPGRLLLLDRNTGAKTEVKGLPEIHARGQGGLLDIQLDPHFPVEPWLYMTYSASDARGRSSTYLARARLDLDGAGLDGLTVLYAAEPHISSNAHYGSRIAIDAERRVYFSVGDRNSKDFGPQHYSQDRSNGLGSILRLEVDGTIPADNPFLGESGAHGAIFSYGHRNPQGLAFHPMTGELWSNEHGERNGDEINVITAGGNYGWPVATYSVGYMTGRPFAVTPPERPDTVPPVYFWSAEHPEGFPPSGLAFYYGEAFPEWEGNLFMGNLRHQYLGRFVVNGQRVEKAERLLADRGWRIRDVAVGPDDGFLYVLIDQPRAPLIRLRPVQ
jgi:glucose/arabinose dehydrogenase